MNKNISTLPRYIQNKLLKSNFSIDESEIFSQCKEKLNENLQTQIQNSPPNSKYKIYSTGRKKKDFSIYSGTGGNIYTFWRYYKYSLSISKENINDSALNYLLESYKINLALIQELESSEDFELESQSTAFFHGPVGIYTMGCIIANELKDKEMLIDNLQNVLKYKDLALSDYSEDELLYGNAGYLYSLNLIYKHIFLNGNFAQEEAILQELTSTIISVVDFQYKIGLAQQNKNNTEFLIYPFPRKPSSKDKGIKIYYGGAHGVFGVLFQILISLKLLSNNSEILAEIKISLLSLAKIQLDSGNFPSSMGSTKDELVQFCHGATGAVHLYALAYDIYKEEAFLEVVEKCGNVLWERGILTKGNGVCHGITGITYALYRVYKLLGNEEWKNKFYAFVTFTYNEDIQKFCKKFDDPRRAKKGIPDTPYSLMEGLAGDICFYSDFLSGEILFPGYEI